MENRSREHVISYSLVLTFTIMFNTGVLYYAYYKGLK